MAAPIVDLAPDPSDPQRLVATTVGGFEQGVFASENGGQNWKRLNYAVGLIAWPAGGRTWTRGGEVGGQPAALLAVGEDELYVALHDGTIKRSTDRGATWTARSTP